MTALLGPILAALAVGVGYAANQDKRIEASRADTGQETEIRRLIEELVLVDREVPGEPTMPPVHPNMSEDKSRDYKQRYERCQRAFDRLTAFKEVAFPFLVEHFTDRRQSLGFRNHKEGQSVGDACQTIIYFQLVDHPKDYSSYGHYRIGRDGGKHVQPYWQGTPFDEAGGVAQWLEQNKNLSYAEKQIKCLNWLLDREKQIGAPDASSYFQDILPLEIRILERKQETGEDVAQELDRLRGVLQRRDVNAVPKNLLPEKAEQPDRGERG